MNACSFLTLFFFDETENTYPSQIDVKNYAKTLGLSNKQIRNWFVKKRRKEKSDNESHDGIDFAAKKTVTQSSLSKLGKRSVFKTKMNTVAKRRKKLHFAQDIFSADYILAKVFRKDGPPLGVEFDSLPSQMRLSSKGLISDTCFVEYILFLFFIIFLACILQKKMLPS